MMPKGGGGMMPKGGGGMMPKGGGGMMPKGGGGMMPNGGGGMMPNGGGGMMPNGGGGTPKTPTSPTSPTTPKGHASTGAAHHSSTGTHKSTTPAKPTTPTKPTPAPVASSSSQRAALVACGQALYNNRAKEHYTEGGSRWQGIQDKIRPPSAPTYSDCSSAVSWCYWTVFGNGPDIINGDNWQGGYTGTMASHGTAIPCSSMQPGDVALYGSGSPWDHAEMYMGNGQMVSHGADPVSYEPSSSLQGFAQMQCRRYFN